MSDVDKLTNSLEGSTTGTDKALSELDASLITSAPGSLLKSDDILKLESSLKLDSSPSGSSASLASLRGSSILKMDTASSILGLSASQRAELNLPQSSRGEASSPRQMSPTTQLPIARLTTAGSKATLSSRRNLAAANVSLPPV